MSDPKIEIFLIRFADNGELIPHTWLQKSAVDACAQVRIYDRDRKVQVTGFQIIGLAALRRGPWDGEDFYRMWHKELDKREAQARADERNASL